MTTSTPGIIKKIEELVLARAGGVDPFEEILKLVYIKLYSEKTGEKIKEKLPLQSKKIKMLFNQAKKEWPGMFHEKDSLELSPAHLNICLHELEKIELFHTDLEIIDTAFEYLLPKTAKGSRGQYFTPRHIISEVIKILNPQKKEYILDPACGSGGFLLHTGRHISQESTRIYGIDFDKRMVKIAKALTLISGLPKTHIYNIDSLGEIKELKNLRFDVICANPPFGGEIRDKIILYNYELAKNGRGKVLNSVERHILFIERIIHLLRPGGRAAIVVPQGILNNTNLAYIREWLFKQARIIGVIGLDANTFKPHTNVKTSLLFFQKWRKNKLPDYPVFMAVSQKSGKDKSGKLIDHDLDEITKRLRDFIKKEKLGF